MSASGAGRIPIRDGRCLGAPLWIGWSEGKSKSFRRLAGSRWRSRAGPIGVDPTLATCTLVGPPTTCTSAGTRGEGRIVIRRHDFSSRLEFRAAPILTGYSGIDESSVEIGHNAGTK